MSKIKIAEAFVEIKGDKGKLSKTLKNAKRETTLFARSATKSLKMVTIGMTALGVAAAATATIIATKLTSSIIRAGIASVKTAIQYDKLSRGLAAVVGGSQEAERQLERLSKVAELPGLSFRGAIQGSINLQAAGLSAELAERSLKAFGNALVTVGKGSADLAGVNLALTQIANRTSGFGQEIRQLQERLPQMQIALKGAFDGKPLEDLSITGKQLVAALVTEFEKLPPAAGGVANSVENIGIAFDRLKNEIGKAFIPVVEKALNIIIGLVDQTREKIAGAGGLAKLWELHANVIKAIFQDIATTGIKLVGIMITGISDILQNVGIVAWEWYANRFKETWREAIEDVLNRFLLFADGSADRLQKSQERQEGFQKGFNERSAQQTEKMKAVQEAAFKSINAVASNTYKDVLAELTAFVAKYNENLGKITIETSKAIAEPVKNIKEELSKLEKIDPKDLDFFPAITAPLSQQQRILEGAKRIADFNRERDRKQDEDSKKRQQSFTERLRGIFRILEGAHKERLQQSADLEARDIARMRRTSDNELTTQQEVNEAVFKSIANANKKRIKDAKETFARIKAAEMKRFDELSRAWEAVTAGFQVAFSDMFAGLLGADTRKSWERFWSDLKNIAIRNLAEIAVSQAFKQLFNLLNNLDFNIRGAGGGGKSNNNVSTYLEVAEEIEKDKTPDKAPGRININFPNADIEHMSQARIEAVVQRAIVPALLNMEKRGIIARR